MISALKKRGLKELINKVKKEIPKKKWIYDISDTTDQKDDFICSEITREKIFKFLNKELPYNVRIQTEIVKKKTIYKIFQTIFIKKESQKAILIGKNGEKLKRIAMNSRLEMEKKYKQKIFLEVFVTTEKKNR